jgi:hypothetical protein
MSAQLRLRKPEGLPALPGGKRALERQPSRALGDGLGNGIIDERQDVTLEGALSDGQTP